MKAILAACLLTVACAVDAVPESTVFLVRHAERADTAGGAAPTMAADPDLSPAGRTRAESLAAALKDAVRAAASAPAARASKASSS